MEQVRIKIDPPLTVGEFLAITAKALQEHGYQESLHWSEQLPSAPLEKRHAAAILHELLLSVIHEEDAQDWDAALELQDLMECHTCVRHIAQMYVKGIQEAESAHRFGVRSLVTVPQAEKFLQKLWYPALRTPPKKMAPAPPKRLSLSEAAIRLAHMPRRVLIDVRDAEEFAKNPVSRERINIPFPKLQLNPYQAAEDRSIPIFLFCRSGYLATLAAKLLTAHGYQDVTAVIPNAKIN